MYDGMSRQRLKRDVAREAKRYDQRVLVYDETSHSATSPTGELVARWETVKVGTIQTLENAFEMLQQDGYRYVDDRKRCKQCFVWYRTNDLHTRTRSLTLSLSLSLSRVCVCLHLISVQFVRLPVGSQRAPDLAVLDQLTELVRTAPANSELIFNCQMGRGRTSMLMVCAVLLCNFFRGIPMQPFDPILNVCIESVLHPVQVRLLIDVLLFVCLL
jgi:hypothetical protein